MTKYREILRLKHLGFSERNIARTAGVSRNTVKRVVEAANAARIDWTHAESMDDATIEKALFPDRKPAQPSHSIDFEYIRKELLRNGVTKKLLWTEYCESCRLCNREPLMYSQFCHYIQQEEQKRRATMRIPRRPAETVEVDWAGDPAHVIDPDTGEPMDAHLFVATLPYSQYTYVEAFTDEKTRNWIRAHVHMYDYFGGVTTMLVPDNCTTAVNHSRSDRYTAQLNRTYGEMAEHYGTAVIPARVRHPKDKASVEGNVGKISSWITAALRDEEFFSLAELNEAIRERLETFNARQFQKKECSRRELFESEERPLLKPLPATPFEVAEWKTSTVQFNYHIALDGMYYSVPYQYIKKQVESRLTDTAVEVFYGHERIASHARLRGRPGQYSTVKAHMPEGHREYLEWDGDRFRRWASGIGEKTAAVIDALLRAGSVELQSYRACMGVLKLGKRHGEAMLEWACGKALGFTSRPSYKNIRDILQYGKGKSASPPPTEARRPARGITRGARNYGGER